MNKPNMLSENLLRITVQNMKDVGVTDMGQIISSLHEQFPNKIDNELLVEIIKEIME
jgi:uncharacterized protein YqeY